MREIKFRAWDKENKLMFPVWRIVFDSGMFGKSFQVKDVLLKVGHELKLDQIELMQYTGLLDKNGKEGYHKDICEHESGLYSIEWIGTDAKFVLMQMQEGILKDNTIDMRYLETMKVIGNIYENPELLDAISA